MQTILRADYGRSLTLLTRRASGDVLLTATPNQGSSLRPVEIVLDAEACRALAALLTVGAKEVQG